eukprot:9373901-Karenia_brevis.AAC.1
MVQPTSAQGWPSSCCKMVQEDFRNDVLYCELPGDCLKTSHVLKAIQGCPGRFSSGDVSEDCRSEIPG